MVGLGHIESVQPLGVSVAQPRNGFRTAFPSFMLNESRKGLVGAFQVGQKGSRESVIVTLQTWFMVSHYETKHLVTIQIISHGTEMLCRARCCYSNHWKCCIIQGAHKPVLSFRLSMEPVVIQRRCDFSEAPSFLERQQESTPFDLYCRLPSPEHCWQRNRDKYITSMFSSREATGSTHFRLEFNFYDK